MDEGRTQNIITFLKCPLGCFLGVMALMLLLTGCGQVRQNVVIYSENLDQTAVTVDGTDYTLRNLAFYIAYEENVVQDEAKVYNPDNTSEYWNLHTDGKFIRVMARDEAMNMAVHDIIFYNMAMEEGVTLTASEKLQTQSKENDFWNDLTETRQQRLAVPEEAIYDTLEKMALAEKYQEVYAALNEAANEDYDSKGNAYKKLLEEHKVKVNTGIWNGLKFGDITLQQ